MMDATTKKAVFNTRIEEDSEFEKPYIKDIAGYPAMQHFYPKDWRVPYRGPEPVANPTPDPGKEDVRCPSGRTAQLVSPTHGAFPVIKCGDGVSFENVDGVPLVWCRSIGNDDGVGVGSYDSSQGDCGDECFDDFINIQCEDECGQHPNIIIKVVVSPTAVGISGPSAVTDSGTFTVTGGIAPYTWSASCGVMTVQVDTSIMELDGDGCCEIGSVTVTDACGSQALKEIQFGTGSYVEISSCDGNGANCNPGSPCCCTNQFELFDGNFKWDVWTCCGKAGGGQPSICGDAPISFDCVGAPTDCIVKGTKEIKYEWQC